MIDVGEVAPDFTLPSDSNGDITLSELRGSKVVLYFYPKDDTPGCTIQACDFRDGAERFRDAGTVVLGVSADSVESHADFREKFGLNFPLLADTDHHVSGLYGVLRDEPDEWGLRIVRSTFLIDEEGVLAGVWRKVQAQGHMEILADTVGA